MEQPEIKVTSNNWLQACEALIELVKSFSTKSKESLPQLQLEFWKYVATLEAVLTSITASDEEFRKCVELLQKLYQYYVEAINKDVLVESTDHNNHQAETIAELLIKVCNKILKPYLSDIKKRIYISLQLLSANIDKIVDGFGDARARKEKNMATFQQAMSVFSEIKYLLLHDQFRLWFKPQFTGGVFLKDLAKLVRVCSELEQWDKLDTIYQFIKAFTKKMAANENEKDHINWEHVGRIYGDVAFYKHKNFRLYESYQAIYESIKAWQNYKISKVPNINLNDRLRNYYLRLDCVFMHFKSNHAMYHPFHELGALVRQIGSEEWKIANRAKFEKVLEQSKVLNQARLAAEKHYFYLFMVEIIKFILEPVITESSISQPATTVTEEDRQWFLGKKRELETQVSSVPSLYSLILQNDNFAQELTTVMRTISEQEKLINELKAMKHKQNKTIDTLLKEVEGGVKKRSTDEAELRTEGEPPAKEPKNKDITFFGKGDGDNAQTQPQQKTL